MVQPYETGKTLIATAVTPRDCLLANVAAAVLGIFQYTEKDAQYIGQLNAYWKHMSRGVENAELVPWCWFRMNIAAAACHEVPEIMALVGGERDEREGGSMVRVPMLTDEWCLFQANLPLREYRDDDRAMGNCPCMYDEEPTLNLARMIWGKGGTA